MGLMCPDGRDLGEGRDLDDTVENVSGNVAWGDNKTLFYLTKVGPSLHPIPAWHNSIGAPAPYRPMS
jgi:protease II